MQKTIKTLAIIILSSVTLSAQNKVMNFDGVNDYVTTPIDADLQAISKRWGLISERAKALDEETVKNYLYVR